jgi:hypothetical protein
MWGGVTVDLPQSVGPPNKSMQRDVIGYNPEGSDHVAARPLRRQVH